MPDPVPFGVVEDSSFYTGVALKCCNLSATSIKVV